MASHEESVAIQMSNSSSSRQGGHLVRPRLRPLSQSWPSIALSVEEIRAQNQGVQANETTQRENDASHKRSRESSVSSQLPLFPSEMSKRLARRDSRACVATIRLSDKALHCLMREPAVMDTLPAIQITPAQDDDPELQIMDNLCDNIDSYRPSTQAQVSGSPPDESTQFERDPNRSCTQYPLSPPSSPPPTSRKERKDKMKKGMVVAVEEEEAEDEDEDVGEETIWESSFSDCVEMAKNWRSGQSAPTSPRALDAAQQIEAWDNEAKSEGSLGRSRL